MSPSFPSSYSIFTRPSFWHGVLPNIAGTSCCMISNSILYFFYVHFVFTWDISCPITQFYVLRMSLTCIQMWVFHQYRVSWKFSLTFIFKVWLACLTEGWTPLRFMFMATPNAVCSFFFLLFSLCCPSLTWKVQILCTSTWLFKALTWLVVKCFNLAGCDLLSKYQPPSAAWALPPRATCPWILNF